MSRDSRAAAPGWIEHRAYRRTFRRLPAHTLHPCPCGATTKNAMDTKNTTFVLFVIFVPASAATFWQRDSDRRRQWSQSH
jgi:hypothetical protein